MLQYVHGGFGEGDFFVRVETADPWLGVPFARDVLG